MVKASADASSPGISVLSLLAIVVLGAIPAWGVHAYGWEAAEVSVFYGCESLIVAAFAFARMITAEHPGSAGPGSRLRPRVATAIPYGLLSVAVGLLAWLVAVFVLSDGDAGAVRVRTFGSGDFWSALMGVALLQGMVFWREWVRTKAWMGAGAAEEAMASYGRIAPLVVAIPGLGLMGLAHATATPALLALCALKLLCDLLLTLRRARFRVRFDPVVERR